MFEYSEPDVNASIVQELLILLIDMLVPATRVMLSCLLLDRFEIFELILPMSLDYFETFELILPMSLDKFETFELIDTISLDRFETLE